METYVVKRRRQEETLQKGNNLQRPARNSAYFQTKRSLQSGQMIGQRAEVGIGRDSCYFAFGMASELLLFTLNWLGIEIGIQIL